MGRFPLSLSGKHGEHKPVESYSLLWLAYSAVGFVTGYIHTWVTPSVLIGQMMD
ncbi:hypothetical protein B0H34DRAFT_703731 [Crassisporium funariophilum]|nr:hypothetical protein B0H34DRAFT_703731 [Crassisporium funariophilum]